MKITIPELSLVVLIGPSGCGKSSFARAHFKPTEVLSSDLHGSSLKHCGGNSERILEAFFTPECLVISASVSSPEPRLFISRHAINRLFQILKFHFSQFGRFDEPEPFKALLEKEERRVEHLVPNQVLGPTLARLDRDGGCSRAACERDLLVCL